MYVTLQYMMTIGTEDIDQGTIQSSYEREMIAIDNTEI